MTDSDKNVFLPGFKGRTGKLTGPSEGDGKECTWKFVVRAAYMKRSSLEWKGMACHATNYKAYYKHDDLGLKLLIELEYGQLVEIDPGDARVRLDGEPTMVTEDKSTLI